MRASVMILFLALAVPCHAEDPLEGLNSVEDAVKTMQRALALQERGRAPAAWGESVVMLPLDDRLYFISDEEPGARDWVPVKPCTEEIATARALQGADSCVGRPDGSVSMGPHFWKSRPAARGDLRVGAFVVARGEIGDGGWVLTRITDLSELNDGFVAVAAPFRAAVGGLRVVD